MRGHIDLGGLRVARPELRRHSRERLAIFDFDQCDLLECDNSAPRQTPWKPSKKGPVVGRERKRSHGLQRIFRVRPGSIAGRTPLPRVCRPRTHRRPLSARPLAFPARPARGGDLVLQRLSRHGPAPQGDRRHGRCRRPHGHRRRRHPQYRRHQSSAGRAGARARRPARQAGRAGVHLRLCLEPDRHPDHRQAVAQLPAAVRRAQPQFHDRGRAPVRLREADLAA